MPQTPVVGRFMDTLGAFYEIVDEDSPIEQARRAKLLPPDHNYNLQPPGRQQARDFYASIPLFGHLDFPLSVRLSVALHLGRV